MLALLRRKARSPLIQAAVVIIILVFIFWLPQMGGDGGPGTVALVNDEPISSREFQRRYDDLLTQYRDQLGGVIPPELLEALGLKQQVVNQLIQEKLLLQSARKTGLPATGAEVQRAIQEMGEFSENGVFSLDIYRQILTGARLSVAEFEEGIRVDLLRRKIIDHLVGFAQVSEAEVRERFQREHDRVRLNYVRLAAADFLAGLSLDEEELAAHYEANRERYRREPRLALDYLLFSPERDGSGIGEEEIAAYYEANRERFDFPEQRRARHILIRSAENAPAEEREAQRRQMEEVLTLARQGADFVELALLYSEDASAADGGDLGYFRRGEMLEPIEEAAFALNPGEISGIIESRFGFHILQLDEVQPARQVSLTEARAEIVDRLLREQGRQDSFVRAGEIYELILTEGSLQRGAEAAGVSLSSTGLFARSQPPAQLARYPEVVQAAFNLEEGELSSIVAAGDSYAVLYVREKEAPRVPPLEEVRERVEADLRQVRAREAARRTAEEMLAALHEGDDLATVAAAHGQTVRESGWFARATMAAADLPSAVAEAGLALSPGRPLPDRVESAAESYYVISLAGSQPGDEALFERWAGPLRQDLLRDKQEALIDTWINHLVHQADIRLTPGAI